MPKRSSGVASSTAERAEGAKLHRAFRSLELVEVHRSEIRGAEYNPRHISDKAKDALRRGIEKLGIVDAPVVNRRTMTVVGGHQRLAVLDAIAGSPDYRLRVQMCDLSEKEEREANILLNNPEAQGDWDLEKLAAVLPGLDLDATGFDAADVYRLLGDSPLASADNALDDLADRLRASRDAWQRISGMSHARLGGKDSEAYYIVVVFRDREDRNQFLEAAGLDQNRYQDGRRLRELILRAAKPTE